MSLRLAEPLDLQRCAAQYKSRCLEASLCSIPNDQPCCPLLAFQFETASTAHTCCRLREWVEALLWDRQPDSADVFRMKGVLHVAGSQTQRLLQVIGAAAML